MDELCQWIRAAEAARATCANVSEFDMLILQHKQRLDSKAVSEAPKVREPDENSDIKLIRELIFEPRNVVLQSFSKEEMTKGKTPDFKLMKWSTLEGYCELKSPRDDWVFELPDNTVATRKSPTSNTLGRQIISAVEQFDAINPDHKLPNVLVLVNHARGRTRSDLHVALTGIPVPGGTPLFTLKPGKQQHVWEAARRVDLFLWVDAKARSWQHAYVSDAPHRAEACALLGIQD
jgi:hypothetical protein